jgi:23S rRNA (uracil1939-C5)-methyltransferase
MHSSEPWGYRNRIRLHAVEREGKIRFGYKQRRSHTVFVVDECPIAAAVLVQSAIALSATLGTAAWAAQIDEVEIFCDGDESALQVSILLRPGMKGEAAGFASAMKALSEGLPELRGAGMYEQAAEAGALAHELATWGDAALSYSVGGHEYRVTRGAFFQVNRFISARLVELVTAERGGALVWDLYAGVGLFSVALAAGFARVVAVEAAAPAVGDLRHNLAAAGEQHRAIAATTLEFLRRTAASSSKKPPQLIVMDPPRAGLGAEVCRLLGQVGAAEIVYVSCDPVTLTRDVAALIESGYHLQAMHSVDMFPQTFHMETVTVLRRG